MGKPYRTWFVHCVHSLLISGFSTQIAEPPTATLDVPPTSPHFSDSQRIHTKPEASGDIPTAVVDPGPPAAPTPPYGYPPFAPPPFYQPPSYPYPPFMPYGPLPPYPFMDPRSQQLLSTPTVPQLSARPQTPVNKNAPGSAPTSPLKITLPYPVSLSEFCEQYEIDEEDQARLARLKFQPGDRRAEKLEREDWHGHAGFSKLSWDDFVTKHKVFVRDIKAGCFKFACTIA